MPFDFNTQQDVPEILQVDLDELQGVSLAASQLISRNLSFVPMNQKKILIF